jgi:hypothetical protein
MPSFITPRKKRFRPNEQTGYQADIDTDPTGSAPVPDPTTPPKLATDPQAPMRFDPNESMGTAVMKVLAQQEGMPYTPGADAGTVPADARFDEVLKASETSQTGGAAASAQAEPAQTAPPLEESPEAEYARLSKEKPKDRNGRLKSSLLNLLDRVGASAQQELASGRAIDEYSLARMGGAAAGGAIRGGADPAIDERTKSKRRMLELQGQIKWTQESQRYQAQTARMAQTRTAGGQTPAQLSSQRRTYSNFLSKFYPHGYKRGTRADVDSELVRLEMEPPPALPRKGGSGFNPQRVKTVGSDVVYVDSIDGEPVVVKIYSSSGMTEAEKRRQAIDIARLNQARSRDGQPPLEFPEEVYSQDGAPAPAIQPRAASPAPGAAPGAAPGVAPIATPEPVTPAPAPGSQAGDPRLVPVPGGKPEPVTNTRIRPRHGRGGGGRRGGRAASSGGAGGSGGLDKFEQGRLDKYENEAAQARARAASLHSRGEDGSAELEAARVAEQTASRLKAKQGGRGGRGAPSTAAPRRGDPLGILN